MYNYCMGRVASIEYLLRKDIAEKQGSRTPSEAENDIVELLPILDFCACRSR